jgi:rhodanese-related sulfurtransferase
MSKHLKIIAQAVAIAVVASLVGLGVNTVSPRGIPLVYTPPQTIQVGDLEIPVIDEASAFELYEKGTAVFLDAREEEDFSQGRIPGAMCLPEPHMQERFPMIEPLLPEDSTIVLYCSGPECHMAEQVAGFLAQLGYQDMHIMTAGYIGWEQAGFPTESDDS